MKTSSFFFVSALLLFLAGCYTLESTTQYYRVLTPNPLPPHPEGTVIPILDENQTRRSYKVIGEMEFQSGASDGFVLEAVQYNARIHGADAVILKQWEKEEESYVTWVPGWHVGAGYGTDYYYYGCDTGIFWSDYYTAPRYETHTRITHRVKAQMIAFLDGETFGYLGLVFEDVRNSDFLEIGKVLPGSPADRAGLRPGDRVFRIGAYRCDRGRDHFFDSGPVFRVGEENEVEFERGGERRTLVLTAARIPSP